MRRFCRFLVDLAREISDESGYRRYLAAHNLAHSSDHWRDYFDRRMREKYSRAKCC